MHLLTKKPCHAIRQHVYKNPYAYRRFKPVPGSLQVLRTLLPEEDKYFVACVISQQGFGLTVADKYFVHKKLPIASYGVGYGKSKTKKADVFFEDDPSKFLGLVDVAPHLFLHE